MTDRSVRTRPSIASMSPRLGSIAAIPPSPTLDCSAAMIRAWRTDRAKSVDSATLFV